MKRGRPISNPGGKTISLYLSPDRLAWLGDKPVPAVRRLIDEHIAMAEQNKEIMDAVAKEDPANLAAYVRAGLISEAQVIEAVRQSEVDIKEGNVIPWEEAKKELGL